MKVAGGQLLWSLLTIGSALSFLLTGGTVLAQLSPTSQGRALAATCASCHGTNGESVGGFKSLAGRRSEELTSLMQEFKTGKRQGTLMPQLAKGYTDEQIVQLSDWFAAQRTAR